MIFDDKIHKERFPFGFMFKFYYDKKFLSTLQRSV